MQWFAEARALLESTPPARMPRHLRCAHTLLTHPRWGAIRLLPALGGFVELRDGDPLRYDGLTSQLTDLFHPLPLGLPTGGARTGGSARGSFVDDQLAALVNEGRAPEGVHPFTLRTMNELRAQNLQPFAAQVAVGCPRLRLATALDLLCVDLDAPYEDNVVNVQLKTMGPNNYDRTTGVYFQAPLARCHVLEIMPDSYANRHALQIVVEHALAYRHFRIPLRESVVLMITEGVHRVTPVLRDPLLVRGVMANLARRLDQGSEVEREVAAVRHRHAVRQVMRGRASAARAARNAGRRQ